MKKVIEMFPEFHQEKLETTDIKDENNLIVVDTNFLLQMGTSKNTSRASRASNLSLIYSLFLVNFCL